MKRNLFRHLLILILIVALLGSVTISAYATSPTSAAGQVADDYLDDMGNETFALYKILLKIAFPLFVLTIGYFGFQILYATWLKKGEFTMDKIKGQALLAIGALICLVLLPGMIGWAKDYVAGNAWVPPSGLQPLVGDWSALDSYQSSVESGDPLTTESGIIEGYFYNPHADSGTSITENLEYWLYIPDNATSNMPLIIFLHGSGDPVNNFQGIRDYGMMKNVRKIYGDNYPFIGLQPCTPSYGWENKPLKELIDFIVEEYQINPNKIILTGHSMGAVGVWYYMGMYGDFFSAAVPVSWWAQGGLPDYFFDNWAEIPTRAYYGTEEAKTEYQNMASYMTGNVRTITERGGQAELIALPGYMHYQTKDMTYTEELIEWMIAQ